MSSFETIQAALLERADLNARLSLIPYEGTPEIKDLKGQKYLYPHNYKNDWVKQEYLPSQIKNAKYYLAKDNLIARISFKMSFLK